MAIVCLWYGYEVNATDSVIARAIKEGDLQYEVVWLGRFDEGRIKRSLRTLWAILYTSYWEKGIAVPLLEAAVGGSAVKAAARKIARGYKWSMQT